jgi:hypothetical protein
MSTSQPTSAVTELSTHGAVTSSYPRQELIDAVSSAFSSGPWRDRVSRVRSLCVRNVPSCRSRNGDVWRGAVETPSGWGGIFAYQRRAFLLALVRISPTTSAITSVALLARLVVGHSPKMCALEPITVAPRVTTPAWCMGCRSSRPRRRRHASS